MALLMRSGFDFHEHPYVECMNVCMLWVKVSAKWHIFYYSFSSSGDSQMSVRCSPVESEQDSASEPSPGREVDTSSKTDDRRSVSPGDSTWRRHDSGMNGSPPQNTEVGL